VICCGGWAGVTAGTDRQAMARATIQPMTVQPRNRLMTATLPKLGTCRRPATSDGVQYAAVAKMIRMTVRTGLPALLPVLASARTFT